MVLYCVMEANRPALALSVTVWNRLLVVTVVVMLVAFLVLEE
jgi:hypothetical protein